VQTCGSSDGATRDEHLRRHNGLQRRRVRRDPGRERIGLVMAGVAVMVSAIFDHRQLERLRRLSEPQA
jgi:hypothetical protein